jgi:hypothetical protein
MENTSENQEKIGKIILLWCFCHILISELLALLRLIPKMLAKLNDNIRSCLSNCLKTNESLSQ